MRPPLLLILVLLAGGHPAPGAEPTAGQLGRFLGVNCYDLAERAGQADAVFAHLATHGVRVVRF